MQKTDKMLKFTDLDKFSEFLYKKLIKTDYIITLSGELGAGKTRLVKKIMAKFNIIEDEVTSPTFAILNIYNTKKQEIYHYDLYRIKQENELLNLDLEYALENKIITLIEWPEIAKPILKQYKILDVKIIVNNNNREFYVNYC